MSLSAHIFSWNSRLLKVQKHDNKQNFDSTVGKRDTAYVDHIVWNT